MKGTFFNKPLEYKIEIDGESWTQGSKVTGNIIIVNHSKRPVALNKNGCHLCFTNIKKLKAKDTKAFNLIESILFEQDQVDAKSEIRLDFEFNLKEDCPITENTVSLYIVCGVMETAFDGGQLQLKIIPIKVISNFIEIFESFFKFKFKTLKNKKEFIEAKIVAPDSKEWTSVQGINLQMKMQDTNLILNFAFKLKKLDYTAGGMDTKDVNLDIARILTKKEYSSFSESPNQTLISKAITEVIDQVKLKPII